MTKLESRPETAPADGDDGARATRRCRSTRTPRSRSARGSCSRATTSWTSARARRRRRSSTTEPRCPLTQTAHVGVAPGDPRRAHDRHAHRPPDAAGRVRDRGARQGGGAEALQPGDPLLRARLPPHGAHQRRAARLRAEPRPARLLRGQARTFGALAEPPGGAEGPGDRPERRWPARWPARTSALAASVPALRDTLRGGLPGARRRSTPRCRTLRVFSRRGAARRALHRADARRGDPLDRAGARARAAGRAAGPGRRPAPGGAQPRAAQRAAGPAARPAAGAVLVHQQRAGARSPSPRSPASSRATPARRCAGRSSAASWASPARAACTTPTRRSSTSRA